MKHTAFALMGLLGAASQCVIAHPGHGALDGHAGALLHPLLDGGHAMLLAAIGLAALLLRRRLGAGDDRRDKGSVQ